MKNKNPTEFSAFSGLSVPECDAIIIESKRQLGDQLVILGHHYQRDEVYRHADFVGDSLGLSRQAAASAARYIVFCGVHFMAEVSDILTREDQITLLPDLAAGCSMADMANLATVERAWRELATVIDPDTAITPITYINSAADLKAFCGRHGGIICTSTNASKIVEWGFEQREKILFFPDQHLGRNTAYRLGIPLDEMLVWDFSKPLGGATPEQIRHARVILWKGYCSVHAKFKPEHVDAYRAEFPDAKVIAHPEACFEVCQKADFVGSTSYIIDVIREAKPNTRWLVATELNLVNRLQQQYAHQNKIIKFMAPTVSMCSTMFRTDPQHLAWVLSQLVDGHVVHPIKVPHEIALQARIALERMFKQS